MGAYVNPIYPYKSSTEWMTTPPQRKPLIVIGAGPVGLAGCGRNTRACATQVTAHGHHRVKTRRRLAPQAVHRQRQQHRKPVVQP